MVEAKKPGRSRVSDLALPWSGGQLGGGTYSEKGQKEPVQLKVCSPGAKWPGSLTPSPALPVPRGPNGR